MISLTVKTRDGVPHAVQGEEGLTLMEVIRKTDISELMALCGGCCSCATCHVYVEQAPDTALSSGSSDEDELLESSEHRRVTSRLSCQIQLTAEMTGMVVSIAPED